MRSCCARPHDDDIAWSVDRGLRCRRQSPRWRVCRRDPPCLAGRRDVVAVSHLMEQSALGEPDQLEPGVRVDFGRVARSDWSSSAPVRAQVATESLRPCGIFTLLSMQNVSP